MGTTRGRRGSAAGFDYRLALVMVQQGETREQAWARHLSRYPEDGRAPIKIFNCLGPSAFPLHQGPAANKN